MGDLIEIFNPFMHNVVKWPNIMYETVKEDLVKMKDFLVDLLTRLAPNLSALVTLSFFNLKQKSISSLKMCNNLSWGILPYNAEKSNEDTFSPLLRLYKFSSELMIGSSFWIPIWLYKNFRTLVTALDNSFKENSGAVII